MLTPVHVKAYLEQGLSCDDIRVQSDGRHFDAVIVSPAFEGKGLVQQHPLVY